MSRRYWDAQDAEYRGSAIPSTVRDLALPELPPDRKLNLEYDQANSCYSVRYRSHRMDVVEADLMWDTYPINVLREKIQEFITEVNQKEDWGWSPQEVERTRDQLLESLSELRKERE